jgi:hypothetical protein
MLQRLEALVRLARTDEAKRLQGGRSVVGRASRRTRYQYYLKGPGYALDEFAFHALLATGTYGEDTAFKAAAAAAAAGGPV